VKLPHLPPIPPMLAKLVRDFPDEGEYLFEPKWDGFRSIIFRDGDELYIQSRESKPLDRYFPELRQPLLEALPNQAIVDGEIVIAGEKGLDFGALQLRLHPAASRVEKLAKETPASFVAFDLLALGEDSLFETPFSQRREKLEKIFAAVKPPIYLTPNTRDKELGRDWFKRFEGAGLDGVIAKPLDLTYQPDKRVMLKIKHSRTADCAVAGFRWHKKGKGTLIGSLLLGVYDQNGELHSMGITSTFTMEKRRQLLEELEPLRANAEVGHPWFEWVKHMTEENLHVRKPGMNSRWNPDKDLSFEPVRVERVVEVAYDGLHGGRFRHGTTFVRWRPERSPATCTFDQFEISPPYELGKIFGIQLSSAQSTPAHSDRTS
jgi:ATP-dependent DNA ligase